MTEPRLSWEMHDARRGAKQTAYQVLVASTSEKLAADEGDLWDSGRVATDQSTQVVYGGTPLLSRTRCHWKVRLWDADGNPTAYSKPALWSMGLLKPGDIKAQWIGVRGPMYPAPPTRKGPTFDDCVWIWAAEQGVKAREKAPAGTRYFRKSLTVPEGQAHSPGTVSHCRRRFDGTVRQRAAGGGGGRIRRPATGRHHQVICIPATIAWPWRSPIRSPARPD